MLNCSAFDSFYAMISCHCIAQLSVCCGDASLIGDFDDDQRDTEESQSKLIDSLVEKHLRVLELMESADSIYQFTNFSQLASAFGLLVTASFQIQLNMTAELVVLVIACLSQLFLYCIISERVSIWVNR